MEEKPAEVNTGTHGEQVQVWASSGAGACDRMAGRPWHTKGTGGPAVGPLQGPLGGLFTSQRSEAHTSPSDEEVSPLKRLSDLDVIHEGCVMEPWTHTWVHVSQAAG